MDCARKFAFWGDFLLGERASSTKKMTEEKRGEGFFQLLKTFFYHFRNMGGVFMGYTRGIHGVFMGYTYVSGMCRECIGYVSGIYRKIRVGKNEEKMRFFSKKIW